MKQVFLFAFIMPILSTAIFCDEIVYVVTQDSELDRSSGGIAARVSVGEQVFFQGSIRSSHRNIGAGTNRAHEVLVKTEQGQEGWIQANNILLQDNQPLSVSFAARRWIFSYYQDIIFEQRREPLYKYEPFWQEQYDDTVKDTWLSGDPWWWHYSVLTDFYIRNNLIEISYILDCDYIYFTTTKQEQNNAAIIIQCICTDKKNSLPQSHWNTIFNEGETYQFIFKIDGDYMDVFFNNNPEKICTLIGVDEYFVNVIYRIVQEESVDLTRVIWPRRADGSMDYPPPLGIDMTRTYTDIFPVIEAPSPLLDTDETAAGISQTDEVFETRKDSQSLPFGALIAIIGGAVVVAGGIALLIV
ncbi:MAG: hypothetical protein LBI28_08865, partial [Treponema sp.]|nr:hypothetical protein [Treponema sp.]